MLLPGSFPWTFVWSFKRGSVTSLVANPVGPELLFYVAIKRQQQSSLRSRRSELDQTFVRLYLYLNRRIRTYAHHLDVWNYTSETVIWSLGTNFVIGEIHQEVYEINATCRSENGSILGEEYLQIVVSTVHFKKDIVSLSSVDNKQNAGRFNTVENETIVLLALNWNGEDLAVYLAGIEFLTPLLQVWFSLSLQVLVAFGMSLRW